MVVADQVSKVGSDFVKTRHRFALVSFLRHEA